jgi:type VI secretion system protein VasG
MITKDVKSLLKKLNEYTTRSLEAAAGFCITRTHYEVSIEHLLAKFLEDGSGDIPRILDHFNIEKGKVWEELNRTLEGFRTGNAGKPGFSPTLLELIESALIAVTVHHDQDRIRSGAILEVLMDMDSFQLGEYMDTLAEIPRDEFRKDFINIVAGSVEDAQARTVVSRGRGRTEILPQQEGETALERFTIDVTGRARDGQIDPARGRDQEMRQIIDILSRRRQNNPILVGEAGVGKTHVAEGLALRIAQEDVPDSLKEVEIRGLDVGLLEAGAGVKGEFENRLKSVISEVKESPKPIVLFIDEAHLLTGAGGSAGSSDAANLLKPELARGELRTIASTTWSEYKRYIEKDPALARRFQMVRIDEPSEDNACVMLRAVRGNFETHHGIQISNEAVKASVKLAARYISGRQLPDKAVSLMDTAAARVKMEHTAKPAKLDDVERFVQNLDIEIAAIRRDIDLGVISGDGYLAELEEKRGAAIEERDALSERWLEESELVHKINSLQQQLAEEMERLRTQEEAEPTDTDAEPETSTEAEETEVEAETTDSDAEAETVDVAAIKAELDRLRGELLEIQGDDPLVHVDVDESIAAQVVSDWTGIPMGNMLRDEADTLLNLENTMEERILGQSHAIKEVADIVRASKAGIGNPESPIGVFLFVGPSGIGKTECARVLADLLFGGERFMITINMSEYQESHTVSQLKGAPPGYVGYGEGGILTEAVRQRPYSVVVLDEVEKAHRDVLNLFYQVFDKGFMRDGEGREIDFKNTVIIMTGNLGWETIFRMCSGEEMPTADEVVEEVLPELQRHFGVALLARCKVVPFLPLDTETMKGIVKLKLDKIGARLRESHNMGFEYSEDMITRIADRCTQIEAGARNIDYIIDKNILPDISAALLSHLAEETMPERLMLTIDESGDFQYQFE